MYIYINILIIIIFYLKKVGSRCFDPQFQKWVAMWAGVHFITSKDSKRTIFFIVRTSYIQGTCKQKYFTTFGGLVGKQENQYIFMEGHH